MERSGGEEGLGVGGDGAGGRRGGWGGGGWAKQCCPPGTVCGTKNVYSGVTSHLQVD